MLRLDRQMPSMSPSWRDDIKVHPAADLFPMMSDTELDELAADIAKNGVQHPIVWLGNRLLDGRNRVAAIARIADEKRRKELQRECGDVMALLEASGRNESLESDGKKCIRHVFLSDPWGHVFSANLHRRHLTAEQKREVIAALLKANPAQSDRAVAKTAKVSHHTVADVRAEAEGRGQIAHVANRTDTKGRRQPAKKTVREPRGATKSGCYRGNKNGSQQVAADPVIAEPPSPPPQREPPIDPVAEICRMAAEVRARVAALPKILPDERKRLLAAREVRYLGLPAKKVTELKSGAERQRRHRERHPEEREAATP
jgi:hypothetical protein